MDFIFGRGPDKSQVQSAPETIEKLTDRIQNSSLLEDRRGSVQSLRGLARDWKLEVGTKSMPTLINVLQRDRMDVEIVKATIETLNILCTTSKKDGKEDLGKMFAEIFVKESTNFALVMDILADYDFNVRFAAIEFINTLLKHVGPRVQECFLTSPFGISRLIDLLDDGRDAIRNEGLLLLNALSASNAEIQKIIAFENVFERLLTIIVQQGSTDGDIVVQDCLDLMQNLLRYNVSNQNLLRETSCIKQLPVLLVTKAFVPGGDEIVDLPLTHESTSWSDQKSANVNAVLSLISVLAGPKNPNTSVNQTALGSSSLIMTLLDVSCASSIPLRVRVLATECLADLIRGHSGNQEAFTRAAGEINPPIASSIITTLQTMLSRSDFALRKAAYALALAFYQGRPDVQLNLVESFPVSLSGKAPSPTAGSLLLDALLDTVEVRRDPYQVWFASNILLNIFLENNQARDVATSIVAKEGDDQISLLNKCMFTLLYGQRDGLDTRVLVGVLSLMSTWFFDNVKGVHDFLTEGSNVQFLIEQVNQSSGVDPLVQGLAAYLLGLIYEFNDDSEPTFTRAAVQSLVISRIGVDVILSRIERFKESKYLRATFTSPSVRGPPDHSQKAGDDVYFDPVFIEYFMTNSGPIMKSLTSSPTSKAKKPVVSTATPNGVLSATESELQSKVTVQDTTIKSLESKIKALEEQLASSRLKSPSSPKNPASAASPENQSRISDLEAIIATLNDTITEQQQKYDELVQEHDDLMLCLADQDIEMKELKKRLKVLGEEVSDDEEEEGEEESYT